MDSKDSIPVLNANPQKFHNESLYEDDIISLNSLFREDKQKNGLKDSNHELKALIPSVNFDAVPSMSDIEIHDIWDFRNFNILMLASEAGRLDVVQNLLDRGENVNFDVEGETAVSLAYKEGHHEIVLALLKANSKFPENFICETKSSELKAFEDFSLKMHEKVNGDDIEEVKGFLKQNIESNSSLRHFYDPSNCSLLKRAILSRKFEIYELLLSLNIFLGPHELMDEINESLTRDEREELSNINFRISPNLMTTPMMTLMTNTKLSPDSPKEREGEFLSSIRQAFDSLFMIQAIAIVLKIVAASRNFKIIFDFKRDSVTFLDPKSEPYCNGLMYLSGKIYIGAKDLLNPEASKNVIAVIAHELTHYAMCLVYDNWAKPYKEKDKEREANFEGISRECDRNASAEEIVDLVFDCYEKSMQHAELIVRVPHMIAFYLNNLEILNERRRIFQSLFDFYEQICVPEMEAKLPKIEKKFCPVRKVKKNARKHKRLSFLFATLLILGSIASAFMIFWLSPVSWSELNEEDQDFIKNSLVDFKGVKVNFSDLYDDNSVVYGFLQSDVIKRTLKGDAEDLSKFAENNFESYSTITYETMNKELKAIFLNLPTEFQGYKGIAKDVIKDHSVFQHMNSYEIRKSFRESLIKIYKPFPQKVPFIIERFYVDESSEIVSEQFYKSLNESDQEKFTNCFKNGEVNVDNPKVINFEKIIKIMNTSKTFVISSTFGDGKTTTLRHLRKKLKEKFPHKWIHYMNIKKYVKIYRVEKNVKLEDFEVLTNFLGKDILNVSNFEFELFKNLFKSGDVILLWDDVDDISLNDVIALTERINETHNFQIISTRPQYSKIFENFLNVKAHKLIPYSEVDRFEFVVKTIANSLNETGNKAFDELKGNYNKNFETCCKNSKYSKYFPHISKALKTFNYIEKVRESGLQTDRFVSNPVLISIFTNVSLESNAKFNSYHLYKTFIKKLIKQGIEEKILKVHEFHALKLFAETKFKTQAKELSQKLNFDFINENISNILKKLSFDHISSLGIFQINDEKDFDFAHQSFAEFNIAEFFLDEIFSKKLQISTNEDKWILFLFFETWVNNKNFMVISFIRDALKLEGSHSNFIEFWDQQMEANKNFNGDTKILEAIQFSNYFNMNGFDFALDSQKCLPQEVFKNLTKVEETYGAKFVESIFEYRTVGEVSHPLLCENSLQLLEAARNFSSSEFLKLLIEVRGSFGENAFMKFVSSNKVEQVQKFWKILNNTLSEEDRKKLLKQFSKKSWTVLHHSAQNEDPKVFEFVKQIYEIIFDLNDVKEIVKSNKESFSKFVNYLLMEAPILTAKEFLRYFKEIFKIDLKNFGFLNIVRGDF